MFTPHQHGGNMSWPRPFVVGFILLMVFLSMSGDGPSNVTTSNLNTDSAATATAADTQQADKTTGVKEQIIYDLSLSNEKLEAEIKKYRQYVLDLRRAIRSQKGCSLEDSSILTLYPELHDDIDIDGNKKGEHEKDSKFYSSKEAAVTTVAVGEEEEEEQQQADVNSTKSDDSSISKHIGSASTVRLQNGRLSKENSTASTRTTLP